MIRILKKALSVERAWLDRESLGAMERKYAEGAKMAKKRIPQLEKAIEILGRTETVVENGVSAQPLEPRPVQTERRRLVADKKQLNLFKLYQK